MTYHAVTTLVRNGLLIPVVDGFDELIGAKGSYDDAFSSLSAFVQELNGYGTIVASARSVYYEQEFVERANTASSLGSESWEQVRLEILQWDVPEIREYIRERRLRERPDLNEDQVWERIKALFAGSNLALRGKPFFLSTVVDLLFANEAISYGDDLLDLLVTAEIRREVDAKLRGQRGNPLFTEDQLKNFFTQLSTEMWHLETRELDATTVRDVAQYVIEIDAIEDEAVNTVVARAPESGSRRSRD